MQRDADGARSRELRGRPTCQPRHLGRTLQKAQRVPIADQRSGWVCGARVPRSGQHPARTDFEELTTLTIADPSVTTRGAHMGTSKLKVKGINHVVLDVTDLE